MNIIVDTCIWSLALRKSSYDRQNPYVQELSKLIASGQVQMIGAVRQELLSGIKTRDHFEKLRFYLKRFPDLFINSRDYEIAAEFYNKCRSKGIQGANTDFLICALSVIYRLPIFTTDKDFDNFRKLIPIKLHKIN